MALENHLLATIIMKHQRMSKLMNEHVVRNRILHGLKVTAHKIFVNPYSLSADSYRASVMH